MPKGLKHSNALSVLLIEGDDQIRIPLENILKTLGHNVTALRSGESGLEAIENRCYDAVVCNYHLPGMDGIDFFTRSRQNLSRATTIMTAAFADDFLANNALALGITVFMEMPYKIGNLIACIEGRTPDLGVAPLGRHLYVTSEGQMMTISPSRIDASQVDDYPHKTPLPKEINRSGRRWKLYRNPDTPHGEPKRVAPGPSKNSKCDAHLVNTIRQDLR